MVLLLEGVDMDLFSIIGWALAAWLILPALYVLYIASVTILAKKATLHKALYASLAPVILIAVAVDFIANVTLVSILFWDIPREYLVTQRLKRYKLLPEGKRKSVADWVCEHMLNPFDLDGHC